MVTNIPHNDPENSPGLCHICGNVIQAGAARSHTNSCIMDAVRSRYAVREVSERYARSKPIILWLRSEHRQHWMMLVAQPTTSLRQLDRFLRHQWLECCGHMSHFEIDDVQYSAAVPGPGDAPMFDNDLAEPDEEHMVHTLEETTTIGAMFHHEFDYGDTTCLDLECVSTIPVPHRYLPEFINPPDQSQGHQDGFITIVARNLPPERCFTCGSVATSRHYENPHIHVPREQGCPHRGAALLLRLLRASSRRHRRPP